MRYDVYQWLSDSMIFPEEPKILIALIDGKEVQYDMCSSKSKDAYDDCKNLKLEYLGEGVLYKVDGVKQSFTETWHFFKKLNTNS